MPRSITQVARNEPFELHVSRGVVLGHVPFHKFGENQSVGTTFEEIWTGSSAYPFRTSAITMTVSSSDANDDLVGTGARTITVEGVDANYAEVVVTLDMDGQVAVTIPTDLLAVNRAYVVGVGTNGSNVGTVYVGHGTVTAGVPATVMAQIEPDYGQTEMAIYTVPAGKTLYISSFNITTFGSNTTFADTQFRVKNFNESWRVKSSETVQEGAFYDTRNYPLKISEKSVTAVRAVSSSGTKRVSASYDGIIIDEVD